MDLDTRGNLKFSIILPTYNRADLLHRSVGSVLNQDYDWWELIIVDDGSTDNTPQVVESFQDERIRYIRQPHSNVSIARNNGIELAAGKYICFLDSDDEYRPNHLSVLERKIVADQYPVALLYTLSLMVQDGEVHKVDHRGIKECPMKIDDYPEMNSICVHREILSRYKFNENIDIYVDMELWSRVLAEYPCIRISEYTTKFYRHGNNMASEAQRRAEGMRRVYEFIFSTLDQRIPIPEEVQKEKMFKVKVGLADAYSQKNRTKESFSYLLKAVSHRPSFIFTRHFLGIVRNILLGSK